MTIHSFEITCAFDCHFSYEQVPSHNSVPSLEACFMELEPRVLSKIGLRSWPGTVSLALDLGFFLGCGLRVKSLKRIMVELSRHVCSLLGRFNCSFCAVRTPLAADEWGTSMPCSASLLQSMGSQDSNPTTYTDAGRAGIQFCGLVHRGHGFPQADFSSHRSSTWFFDAGLQLTLPCGAAPGISHQHDKDGFYTSFFLDTLLRLYRDHERHFFV